MEEVKVVVGVEEVDMELSRGQKRIMDPTTKTPKQSRVVDKVGEGQADSFKMKKLRQELSRWQSMLSTSTLLAWWPFSASSS